MGDRRQDAFKTRSDEKRRESMNVHEQQNAQVRGNS
jgi:hypothetical protein